MTELEWKGMASREELARVRQILSADGGPAGRTYVQINYYYDTPDCRLAEGHEMLRIRQKDGVLRAQYKSRRSREGALTCCREEERYVDSLPARLIPSALFDCAPDACCALQGCLVTLRTDFLREETVISLDESYYLGKEDFEIEIEGPDPAAIAAQVRRLGLPEGARGGRGKYFRFLTARKEQSGKGSD